MKSILSCSILALTLPAAVLAAVGGRCSGSWDDGACICLDHNKCTGTYSGYAEEGSAGNYPCPHDAGNVWGCYIVSHCPGRGSNTACVWRNGCEYGTILSDPICPGGNDFVCCAS